MSAFSSSGLGQRTIEIPSFGDEGAGVETRPMLISFYTPTTYYEHHAERLKMDCDRLGIESEIRRVSPDGKSWSSITALKPEFIWSMLQEHKRPVFWIDVDTYLYGSSVFDRPMVSDFSGWLRSLSYLRDWRGTSARTWMVAGYGVNYTESALRFWADVVRSGANSMLGPITDDFMLERGWRVHNETLNVEVLRPNLWATSRANMSAQTEFLATSSGNVPLEIGRVRQHQASSSRPKALQPMVSEWKTNMEHGKTAAAATLWRGIREVGGAADKEVLEVVDGCMSRGQVEQGLVLLDQHIEATETPVAGMTQRMAKTYALALVRGERYDDLLSVSGIWRNSYLPALRRVGEFYQNEAVVELQEQAIGNLDQRTPAYWMRQPMPGNFGDLLTPYIIFRATGRWPTYSPTNGLMGVGSTLKLAKPGQIVWGSGLSRRAESLGPQPRIVSVRGPISADEAMRQGWRVPRSFGDGGLMMPKLLPVDVSTTIPISFIPHIVQQDEGVIDEDVHIINLSGVGKEFVERTVEMIASSEVVASTSLHGIILALSYGRQAIWCKFPEAANSIAGDDMKFADFFMSLGLEVPEPLLLSSGEVISRSTLEKGQRVSPLLDLGDEVEEALMVALATLGRHH